MSRPNGGQSWKVTGQAQTTNVGDDGRFTEGLTVTFTTGAGHVGMVFLPLAAATPENVRAAIDARVQIMDGIANLSGEIG